MPHPKLPVALAPARFADWQPDEPYLSGKLIRADAVGAERLKHPPLENRRVEHGDFTKLKAERFAACRSPAARPRPWPPAIWD